MPGANATHDKATAGVQHMAFVLLARREQLDISSVVEALKRRHPDLAATISTTPALPANPRLANRAFIMNIGGEAVTIMVIGHPLPYDSSTIDNMKQTWPEAPHAFKTHQAHLTIAKLGQSKSSLQAAQITTAAVGGVLETLENPLGVVWNSKIGHSASAWQEKSKSAFKPYPNFPMNLWFKIHSFKYEKGVGVITQGLFPFIEHEIEFEGEGLDLGLVAHRTGGFAAYLMQRGQLIRDGDTFGVTDIEKITVSRTASERFGGIPVLLAKPVNIVGLQAVNKERY